MALTDDERRARNNAYMRGYRERNKAKIAEYLVGYRAEHKDEATAYAAAWHQQNRGGKVAAYKAENKAHIDAYHAAHREKHRERRRAEWLAWKKANPDAVRRVANERRARKKNAEGKLSFGIIAKLMGLQRGKCANCRAGLKASGHHLDHIEPLAKGGSNTDGNVQLLCPSCNLKKHAKDPIAWAQQQGRLL